MVTVREVEQASFTPFVFAITGGTMKGGNSFFYRRFADHLSRRCSTSYNMAFIRCTCTLSFSLFRSATMCIYVEVGPSRIAPPEMGRIDHSTGTFKAFISYLVFSNSVVQHVLSLCWGW